MFEMTPAAQEALIACFTRMPGGYLYVNYSKLMCDLIFGITKYFTQEYMCYHVGFNSTEGYDFNQLSQADKFRGVAYDVFFNKSFFNHATHILNIVHTHSGLPTRSRYYVPEKRRRHGKRFSNEVFYKYTYNIFKYELLPDPYETACGTNDGLTDVQCQRKCLNDAVTKHYGKLPMTWLIKEHDTVDANMKLLTSEALEGNDTMVNTFLSLHTECAVKCPKIKCKFNRYNTELLDTAEIENSVAIGIRVSLPQSPTISVKYFPVLQVEDYLIFLMSCKGTWLGISMLDFNPVKLLTNAGVSGYDRKIRNLSMRCVYLNRRNAAVVKECSELKQQVAAMRNEIADLRNHTILTY